MGRTVQKAAAAAKPTSAPTRGSAGSRQLVREHTSPEVIFAVVGPIGSGTSEVCETLEKLLIENGFRVAVLKAREIIEDWASKNNFDIPNGSKSATVTALQDAGDEFRQSTEDHAAVALQLIRSIRNKRDELAQPGVAKRAFILDSLKHPAEVSLLRSVYQEAFCLIGVVCEEEERRKRLGRKLDDAGLIQLEELMKRDENASEKHGQKVGDAFHLADFFVDNSEPRFTESSGNIPKSNPRWIVTEELARLVDLLQHSRIIRPRPPETAMNHAYGARMRSACLSRQVGAALLDKQGNVIATGTNEVPRAGGGVYGGTFFTNLDRELDPQLDHRCAFHGAFCRNTKEQNSIIDELLDALAKKMPIDDRPTLTQLIRKTRIGQLMEFSRAVHAEMDALLSAARQGLSTCGTRLFVTTFPCHNCARHIVAAGVDEVQFIEPFVKSKAIPLHGDAIATTASGWQPPSAIQESDATVTSAPKALFRPFTGVAPRLYRRAFYKDRDLKDSETGDALTSFPPPDGMGTSQPLSISYVEMEKRLADRANEILA